MKPQTPKAAGLPDNVVHLAAYRQQRAQANPPASPALAPRAFDSYVASQAEAKKPWRNPHGGASHALAAVAKAGAKAATPLLRGLAVVTATSFAAALTVTPWLLQLSREMVQTGPASPFGPTRLLATALARLGAHGPYAVLAGGITLLGTLSASQALAQSRSARAYALLAQAGMGLVAAPFWQAAVAGKMATGLPALGLVAASLLGLQLTLQHFQSHNALGPLPMWAASATLVAAAPVAAGIALGLGAQACMLEGMATLTVAAIAASVHLWLRYRGNTDDRSTTFAASTQERHVDRTKQLNVPGAPAPTVFVDCPQLQQAARALLANHRAGYSCEGLLLLQGPPGTGKTVTAQAIANLGNWPVYRAPTAALFDSPSPQSVLVRWFDELRTLAKRADSPLVAFLDEAEMLFRDRDAPCNDVSAAARKPLALTAAFNHELGGVMAEKNRNIIVVVSTNHPERLDPAIFDRFNGDDGTVSTFALPTPAQLVEVLAGGFAPLHGQYLGLRKVAPYVLSDALRAELEAALQQRPQVGRLMHAAVEQILVAANAAFGPRWRRLQQAQFHDFVEQRLRTALQL